MYSTWQAFSQALLVDNPLLSYIDVWHANFLPPRFTVGEARDLGLWYTCSNELALIRDKSAKCMSRCRQEQAHVLVQLEAPTQPEVQVEPEAPFEPEAPDQAVEEAAVKSVSSLETKSDIMMRRKMTINRFVPGARPAAQ